MDGETEKDMMFRNDRYEHLVHIIREEMKLEHAREAKELEAKVKGFKGRKSSTNGDLARTPQCH